MSINNILTIILSFLLTIGNYNKILIKETLIIESLTLTKEDLIGIIVNNYNIPSNYNNIEITTNYLNSPEYNKIYSVELLVYYEQDVINYNLKLKTINSRTKKDTNNYPIIVISLISLIIVFSIIYIKRSN